MVIVIVTYCCIIERKRNRARMIILTRTTSVCGAVEFCFKGKLCHKYWRIVELHLITEITNTYLSIILIDYHRYCVSMSLFFLDTYSLYKYWSMYKGFNGICK